MQQVQNFKRALLVIGSAVLAAYGADEILSVLIGKARRVSRVPPK